jgi:hypothetical protein
MTGDDEDLRKRFLDLRREEEALAPAFSTLMRPLPVQGRRRGEFLLAACIAASIGAVLWWQRPDFERPRHEPAEFAVSVTEWRAPTEFLLDTPGSELLRTVPAFGGDMGLTIAPHTEGSFRKHATKVLP